MKFNIKIVSFGLTILTVAACQNIINDPYITPCEEAVKTTSKTFQRHFNKADKARANGLCTCRSRGLQSILSADQYNGLLHATSTGKAKMFRVNEQRYLTDLIVKNPNLKGLGKVRKVCSKYGVEVKNSVYRKKEPPASPY